jgi:hypothetical protein
LSSRLRRSVKSVRENVRIRVAGARASVNNVATIVAKSPKFAIL